jgi:hypothetical protein
MVTLKPNVPNLIARIFFLVVAIATGWLFVKFGIPDMTSQKVIFTFANLQIRLVHLLYLITAVAIFLVFTLIMSFLAIIKVEIDSNVGVIKLIGLFRKKDLLLTDIYNYRSTTKKNVFKNWIGLLIKAKDGSVYQVAGQNVECISVLEEYLRQKGISGEGDSSMKFPFN